MDCFGIKGFLTTCCSCRSSDSTATDEVKVTKISKISATGSVHSLLSSVNGDDHVEKKKVPTNGIDNQAYREDESATKVTPQIPQEKIVNEQPRLKPDAPYERQLSQISDISDFSPTIEKGLAEMVLEDLEKSFSQEKTIKEFQKSFRDEEGQSNEMSQIEEQDEPRENHSDKMESKEPESNYEEETKSTPQPEDKRLEWRNKLMADLDNDEDFALTSSSEEEEEEQQQQNASSDELGKKRAKTEEDDTTPVNENTKATAEVVMNSVNSSSTNHNMKCDGLPIVVDAGSYEIRAGLAGEYSPSHNFRTVVGTWRPQVGEAYRETHGDLLFGEDALSKHNALSLKYPIQGGNIEDWKDFESILDYTFSQRLDVDIKDHPLLVTEPANVSKKQRERRLEVVMEALHCPMTQFKNQVVLSALTAGSDVTLVVSSGHGYTEVVPVYYGYAIQNAVQRIDIGGRHVTEYLARLLLKERGINFSSVAELLVLDEMKRQYAEIKSGDSSRAETLNKLIQHELPDGGIVELGAEIYKCTEPIFRPELIGDSDGLGLVELIQQSVKSVDSEVRPGLKSNVLLCGGNCGLKGFRTQLTEKLLHEENSKHGKNNSWRATCCQDLTNSSWIGGSVFADSNGFREGCVTDDDYFEYGSSIIHRKCL